jgi:oligopeptidase B
MKFNRIAFLVTIILLSGCADDSAEPPLADKRPVELESHGDVRIDDYFWLNERDDPEVIAYLDAENAYADSILTATSGLKQRLVDEMTARIKQEDVSAPYRHGDYLYYRRYEEGKEYPIYCRRKSSMDADEEVLLDVNVEAGDAPYYSVQGFQVSPDHTLAVYGIDKVGRRFYDLHFIDLETGAKLPDVVENATSNFLWAADNQTIIYVKQHPETLRWERVHRYILGSDRNELVYEESDETFNTYVYESISGKYIFIANFSTLSTEIRYLEADAPDEKPKVFLPREDEHEYFVTDGGDRFYVMSNEGAANFQLFEAPLVDTAREAWSVVLPHRDDVLIENVDVLRDHIIVSGRRAALTQLEVIDRDSGEMHVIDVGEDVYEAFSGDNYEFDSTVFRYDYESMTTPESVYDYDLVERGREMIKEKEVLGGFSRKNYISERLWATARDGTRIPVSLVYRKGIELNGQNPLLQYAYGSYGYSTDPGFSSNLLSLVDRGFVYAIAHIRGGSEMGRQWYYDGRQFKKMNTFTDFIDVSKFLVEEGYTSQEHLYARGGSAGGLLMGAVLNMAPDMYNGVSTRVPFVDVVTTMLDESIPLTAGEWDEWGDPRKKEFYDYMLSYSPYDQVKRQDYPNVLVTTSLHDSQVQYWEPAKWVAKLRDHKTDNNLLLLQTDMQAGHSGKTGRFQSLEDAALYYTFFLHLEGIAE